MNDGKLYLLGKISGGCTLTVNAQYMSLRDPDYALGGSSLGGGKLIVNGDFVVDDVFSAFNMKNSADSIVVNGDFSTYGTDAYLDAGSLEVNGDFYQWDSGNLYPVARIYHEDIG